MEAWKNYFNVMNEIIVTSWTVRARPSCGSKTVRRRIERGLIYGLGAGHSTW
ncbi:MAG: hypothetical protein ACLSA6_08845 [Holdemania massiliensis]